MQTDYLYHYGVLSDRTYVFKCPCGNGTIHINADHTPGQPPENTGHIECFYGCEAQYDVIVPQNNFMDWQVKARSRERVDRSDR